MLYVLDNLLIEIKINIKLDDNVCTGKPVYSLIIVAIVEFLTFLGHWHGSRALVWVRTSGAFRSE